MRYNLTLEEDISQKLKDLSEKTGIAELDLIRSAVKETLSVSGDFIQIKFKKFSGCLSKANNGHDFYVFSYNPQIKTGKIESVKSIKKVPECIFDILQKPKEKRQYGQRISDIPINAYSIRIDEDLYFVYCYDNWQNLTTNIAEHVLDEEPNKIYAIDRLTFMSFFEEVK